MRTPRRAGENITGASEDIASLKQIGADLARAEEVKLRTRRDHEAARDQVAALENALYAAIQIAKAEVALQYGVDSPALHAVGRKQKSERRRPTRRTPPAE